jgi:hypothetical protein
VSEAEELRHFVFETLADVGATASEADGLVWIRVPDRVRSDLEVPSTFAITFDPERTGDFEAELVAPGSYFLERIVSLAVSRGRWDVARFEAPDGKWIERALAERGLGPETGVHFETQEIGETMLLLFSFRVTLVSDEKRERFHLIAVSPTTGLAWEVDPATADSGLMALPDARIEPDLETAYRLGAEKLRETSREAVDRFRATSLRLLEEEVRRIFGYFDRTIDEIQAADPEGSQDLLRAVRGERDRRLSETLERFDPKARASLCAVRAIRVPTARVGLRLPGGTVTDATLDAWSHRVHGLACDVCHGTEGPWIPHSGGVRCSRCPPTPAGSARPRGRPRSDTPRRGTRDGRGSARSPGGSKARSRAASGRRRGP